MLKKILIAALKYGISFLIMAILFYWASQDEGFNELLEQPKDWGLISVAFLLAMVAILISFIRWHLLVRALDLPLTLLQAIRLGFVGYLFSFVSLGVVGGDAIKAIFIARHIPERKPEAVATVIIDRMIGLFALFLVASCAFFFADPATLIEDGNTEGLVFVQRIGQIVFGVTIMGLIAICILIVPKSFLGRFLDRLGDLPRIGSTITRVINAVRVYRNRLPLLATTLAISICIQGTMTLGIYSIACALPGEQPSIATHFIIVPISMVFGAVPLPGGIGGFEAGLDFLYRGVSTVKMPESQGFVIAIGFRIITLLVAMIGVVFYLVSRREVSQLIKELEADEDAKKSASVSNDSGHDVCDETSHDVESESMATGELT